MAELKLTRREEFVLWKLLDRTNRTIEENHAKDADDESPGRPYTKDVRVGDFGVDDLVILQVVEAKLVGEDS